VAAEKSLRKAVELNSLSPDPTAWLRLSVALDHQQKYNDALDAVSHAVQYSASDARVLNLANQEQARLKQLTGSSAPAPGSNTIPPVSGAPSSAPSGTKSPAPPASGPGATNAPPATTPH